MKKTSSHIFYCFICLIILENASLGQNEYGFKYFEYYQNNILIAGNCFDGVLKHTDSSYYNQDYQILYGQRYDLNAFKKYKKYNVSQLNLKTDLIKKIHSFVPPNSKLRTRVVVAFLIDENGFIQDVYLGGLNPNISLFYDFNLAVYNEAKMFIGTKQFTPKKFRKNRISTIVHVALIWPLPDTQ